MNVFKSLIKQRKHEAHIQKYQAKLMYAFGDKAKQLQQTLEVTESDPIHVRICRHWVIDR